MGELILGLVALLAGLGLAAMFVRAVLLRRVLAQRGLETEGWVAMVTQGGGGKNNRGTSTWVAYRDQHEQLHKVNFVSGSATKGEKRSVRFDPENPARCVVEGFRWQFIFWLVGAAPVLYFAVNMLILAAGKL